MARGGIKKSLLGNRFGSNKNGSDDPKVFTSFVLSRPLSPVHTTTRACVCTSTRDTPYWNAFDFYLWTCCYRLWHINLIGNCSNYFEVRYFSSSFLWTLCGRASHVILNVIKEESRTRSDAPNLLLKEIYRSLKWIITLSFSYFKTRQTVSRWNKHLKTLLNVEGITKLHRKRNGMNSLSIPLIHFQFKFNRKKSYHNA